MRLRVAVSIAIAMTLVLPGIALADTTILDRGLVGEHRLRDRWTNPGAICSYNNEWSQLQSIQVRAPRVLARDVTATEDQQNVGWQFWIKRRLDGRYVTVYASSMQIATASDVKPAPLTRMATDFTPNYFAHFTVVVRMFWFEEGGAIEGMAKHRIDHYTRLTTQDGGAHERACDTGYA